MKTEGVSLEFSVENLVSVVNEGKLTWEQWGQETNPLESEEGQMGDEQTILSRCSLLKKARSWSGGLRRRDVGKGGDFGGGRGGRTPLCCVV